MEQHGKWSPESLEKLGRLAAIVAISEAQIRANPIPAISDALRRYEEMRLAIEEAISILSGSAQVVSPALYSLGIVRPPSLSDIGRDAVVKNLKAREALSRALS